LTKSRRETRKETGLKCNLRAHLSLANHNEQIINRRFRKTTTRQEVQEENNCGASNAHTANNNAILTANGQTKPIRWKKLQPKNSGPPSWNYGINYWLAASVL